jgi:CYTH domain-containing protein
MKHQHEIEYKFLVHPERLPELKDGARMAQGYLGFEPTVRVRTEDGPAGAKAYLTIKGDGLVGRDEFEYPIPRDHAKALLKLANASVVSKTRYRIPAGSGLDWEIDVFEGDNEGLIVAELEVPAVDHAFERPDWVAEDVTRDPAYKNAALARHPFKDW